MVIIPLNFARYKLPTHGNRYVKSSLNVQCFITFAHPSHFLENFSFLFFGKAEFLLMSPASCPVISSIQQSSTHTGFFCSSWTRSKICEHSESRVLPLTDTEKNTTKEVRIVYKQDIENAQNSGGGHFRI